LKAKLTMENPWKIRFLCDYLVVKTMIHMIFISVSLF
jgi:hypothetical protein